MPTLDEILQPFQTLLTGGGRRLPVGGPSLSAGKRSSDVPGLEAMPLEELQQLVKDPGLTAEQRELVRQELSFKDPRQGVRRPRPVEAGPAPFSEATATFRQELEEAETRRLAVFPKEEPEPQVAEAPAEPGGRIAATPPPRPPRPPAQQAAPPSRGGLGAAIAPSPVQPNPNASPEEKTQLEVGWREYLARPEIKAALLQFGINMLQPVPLGGTPLGQIGSSLGAAAGAATRIGEFDRAEAERKRKAGIEERETESKELTAEAAIITAGANRVKALSQVTKARAILRKEGLKFRTDVMKEAVKLYENELDNALFSEEGVRPVSVGRLVEIYKGLLAAAEGRSVEGDTGPGITAGKTFTAEEVAKLMTSSKDEGKLRRQLEAIRRKQPDILEEAAGIIRDQRKKK